MEIINLNNILYNINKIKEMTKCNVICVLKSNCYGMGTDVLKFLVRKVKVICLNDIEEVIDNIDYLKETEVIVFNSIEEKYYKILYETKNIIVTINSISDIKKLNEYCNLRRIRVNLQIDSGMNRLGIKSIEEFSHILNIIKYNDKFRIYSIFSHIGNDLDYQTKRFNQFIDFFNNFDMCFKDNVIFHLYASKYYLTKSNINHLRIGLDLYSDGSKDYLKQVVSVKAKVIRVLNIAKNEKIGYDNIPLEKDSKVALLNVGYYNGLSRGLIGYKIYANGLYYEIISMCMNHMYVMVDDKIDTSCVFEIIGENAPLYKMANHLNTVCAEILVNLKFRNITYLKR